MPFREKGFGGINGECHAPLAHSCYQIGRRLA
jgi:hypothetical protein